MKALVLLSALFISFSSFSQDAKNGEKLYKKCIACHKKDGIGMKSQKAPMIAGQYDWYIESQIIAIQKKERDNKNTKKMWPFVKGLSESDIKDLAAYISSMTPKKLGK